MYIRYNSSTRPIGGLVLKLILECTHINHSLCFIQVEPPTGIINVIKGEAGSIARADVAQFCLDAVTVDDFPYIGQSPCISSVGGTSWVKDRSGAARGEME
jgi:hypothetical protein